MLVEINLLPKEDKNIKTLTVIMVIITLGISAGIYYQYLNAKDSHVQLEQEYSRLIVNRQQLDEEIAGLKNSNVNISAIEQLLINEIPPTKVTDFFVSLLPNDSTIMTLDYNETGEAILLVNLATFEEVANYLEALTDSDWIKNVELSRLSAEARNDTDNIYVVSFTTTLNMDVIKSR